MGITTNSERILPRTGKLQRIQSDTPKIPKKYFSVQVYYNKDDLRTLALPTVEDDTFGDIFQAYFEKRKRSVTTKKIKFSPNDIDPTQVVTYVGKTGDFLAAGALEAQFDDPVWSLMEIDNYKHIKFRIQSSDTSPTPSTIQSDHAVNNSSEAPSPGQVEIQEKTAYRSVHQQHVYRDYSKQGRYHPKLVFDPVGKIQYAIQDLCSACWGSIKNQSLMIRLRMMISNLCGSKSTSTRKQ